MTEAQWITAVISLLAGGAAGAIINTLVTSYRNRRQPVGYLIEIIDVFKKNPDFRSLQAILRTGNPLDSGGGIIVDNFSVARFTIINKGNQDFPEFTFGVTLSGTRQAVQVLTENPRSCWS